MYLPIVSALIKISGSKKKYNIELKEKKIACEKLWNKVG
jgi:hypothetical protein